MNWRCGDTLLLLPLPLPLPLPDELVFDCGAPFGLADPLPLLEPPSRSPVLLLLLLLLRCVLPRCRGTGPLVLGGSALLLDEPASAGVRSNMLVIFRESEVAFFAARVLAFGPGFRAVVLFVLPFGRPRLEPSSP